MLKYSPVSATFTHKGLNVLFYCSFNLVDRIHSVYRTEHYSPLWDNKNAEVDLAELDFNTSVL